MPSPMKFPNSARAAWILRNATKARPRVSPEEREVRALARELGRCLKEASLDQLHEVARLLGRTSRWLDMVRMEARSPGLVGQAVLRSMR